MKKIVNILLGSVVLGFVGCGGTTQQGAMGNYNTTFGGQDINGVWYVQSQQDYYSIELDNTGSVYTVATNNVQKKQIATYSLTSDKELKININGNQAVATYLNADQNSNNCFYVENQISKQDSIFNGKKIKELWCKQSVAANNNQYASDTRPEIIAVDMSTMTDLKDFLYPIETLTTGQSIQQDVYNYEQDSQGNIVLDSTVRKVFTRLKNNPTTIQETHNGYEHKTDEIYQSKILSFTKNYYGGSSDQGYDLEEYPLRVGINSEVVTVGDENIVLTCVVKDIRQGWNLSTLIPQNIKDNLNAATYDFNYAGKVMHIYCGSTTGVTIDSYNAASYGEVLSIITNPDNSGRYEILDKSSRQ